MNDFFSAIDVHLDGKCLLDGTEHNGSAIYASLGVDNMIYLHNVQTGNDVKINLDHDITFDAFALAPDATHCIFGGKNNAVLKYNFEDGTTQKVLQTMGNITALKYAPLGNYIAVGSEQGKAIIYFPGIESKEKCRPGHSGAICSISLSKSGNFLSSIGRDQNLLVYKISQGDQPQEVARYSITRMIDNCNDLTSSFHPNDSIVFSSGATQLQKLQCIQNRWEYSKSGSIMHASQIIMVEVIKSNTLVSSSYEEVCIWSIKQEEKLFEIEQFSLARVIPLGGHFYGSRTDGKIYHYNREIKEEEPMDIEPESSNDKIEFDQEPEKEDEAEVEDEEEERREIDYRQHKKTKADKMITCFPQPLIANVTSPFEGNRFLFADLYGCVIERQEGGEEEKAIEIELEGIKRTHKFHLPRNQNYSLFCLNELGVVYANEKCFGFRPSSETSSEEWQVQLGGIEAVTLGAGWIAVASEGQIRIFDMAAHEVRSIAFDRQLVAVRSFENVLAVVYHQSVPLWGSQQLSMQLYLINMQTMEISFVANTHVPIKPESTLRWVDFSREGMLFSQDSTGTIRAFSLETSEWSRLYVDGVDDLRKIWMIGVKNHKINYWKTSDSDPEPTVAPRFSIKTSDLGITTVGYYPEGMQQLYQKLLWERYCLDHQKARNRLWGSLKLSRSQSNSFYHLSSSILKEREIAHKHIELDNKYTKLVEKYLKARENMRAFLLVQNCIRSLESARKLIELFDYENQRGLAIKLEEYCDEKQKEVDYQKMQIFQFMKLREQAEKSIKPRCEDPMRRTTSRKAAESIPSFSQSFMSQDSMQNSNQRMNLSRESINSENNETDNPFLKKKSNHQSLETKKREIADQIQKFGIKQKVDRKNISAKNISK